MDCLQLGVLQQLSRLCLESLTKSPSNTQYLLPPIFYRTPAPRDKSRCLRYSILSLLAVQAMRFTKCPRKKRTILRRVSVCR